MTCTSNTFVALCGAILVTAFASSAFAKDINLVSNSSFEVWQQAGREASEPAEHPVGWEFDPWGGMGTEIKKVSIVPELQGEMGQYALALDGKIVSSEPMESLRNKTLAISLRARGLDGHVLVRLYEYCHRDCREIDYIAEPIEVATEQDWKNYSALVKMTPWRGAAFAKIGIEASGAEIDTLHVAIADPMQGLSNTSFKAVYSIPLNAKSITVDGKLEEDEWAAAVGVNGGFMNIMNRTLVGRQTDVRLTSDGEVLYISARYDRRANGLKNTIRQQDGNVWEDESLEIFVNPDFAAADKPSTLYQLIINPACVVFDQAIKMSTGQNETEWNCPGLKIGKGSDEGHLVLEVALPLASVGVKEGQMFGLNLCRDLHYPKEYTSLTGLGYKDYDRMIACRVVPSAPAVVWEYSTGSNPLQLSAALRNTCDSSRSLFIELKRTGAQPAALQKQVTLEPLQKLLLELPGVETQQLVADLTVEVSDSEENELFVQTLHFNSENYRTENSVTPPQEKGRFQVEFYPLQKKVNVRLFDMNLRQKLMGGKTYSHGEIAIYKSTEPEKRVYHQKINHFEQEDDVSHLTVAFEPPVEGSYLVKTKLYDQNGEFVEEITGSIESEQLAWANNNIGQKRTVIPPFTPMQTHGSSVTCWGRTYEFAGSGLPQKIVSAKHDVLSQPADWKLDLGDGPTTGNEGKLQFHETAADRVRFSGETSFSKLRITTEGMMEYDGTVFYNATISPFEDEAVSIESLVMEIPLQNIIYFHTAGNHMAPTIYMMEKPERGYVDPKVSTWNTESSYRNRYPTSFYFPPGDGLVWSSLRAKSNQVIGNFLPFLWFGNRKYGFSWFADSDQGWSHDESVPCFTVQRRGSAMFLQIHILAKEITLDEPRQVSFGLIATPVRPRLVGTNVRYKCGFLGFGNPYENGHQSLVCRNFDMAAAALGKMKTKGLFNALYMAGNHSCLADDAVPVMRYEWGHAPLSYYPNGRSLMPYKIYGSDPDRYTSLYCNMTASRVDYAVYQISQWIRKAHLGGLYLDNSYPDVSVNTQHRKGGYIRTDGRVQGVFHTIENRDMLKRVAQLAAEAQSVPPHITIHKTSCMNPAKFAFAELYIDGEHDMSETGYNHMDYYPLVAQEVIGAGAWGGNNGWLPMIKPADLLKDEKASRNCLACLKLFDPWIWPASINQQVLNRFKRIETEFGIDQPDCQFLGYWNLEAEQLLALPLGCKASFYVRPDKGILVYITNFLKQEQQFLNEINCSLWLKSDWRVRDAETGDVIAAKEIVRVQAENLRALVIEPAAEEQVVQ